MCVHVPSVPRLCFQLCVTFVWPKGLCSEFCPCVGVHPSGGGEFTHSVGGYPSGAVWPWATGLSSVGLGRNSPGPGPATETSKRDVRLASLPHRVVGPPTTPRCGPGSKQPWAWPCHRNSPSPGPGPWPWPWPSPVVFLASKGSVDSRTFARTTVFVLGPLFRNWAALGLG